MRLRPLSLMIAASIAPLFWAGQVLLGYFVSAQGCYPGNAPRPGVAVPMLQMFLWTFDAVALAAAMAGGTVSLVSWRRLRCVHETAGEEGRTRFLAVWALCSSLWFFFAILFNVIATAMVPPCAI